MGIAAQFSKTLHEQVRAYAAWPPLTNTFALGDYGIVTDGVFDKMGNIDEFGISFETEQGADATLNFSSDGTRTVRIVGGAEVNPLPLPAAPIAAKLRIEFGGHNAFVAKAGTIKVTSISNVGQVAMRLADADGWKRGYRVVRGVWTAHDAAVALTNAKTAAFELSGNADALAQFELGSVQAGVTLSKEENVGFSQFGKTGVIGLSLFRLKRFGDGPKLLGPAEKAEIEEPEGDELDDDL